MGQPSRMRRRSRTTTYSGDPSASTAIPDACISWFCSTRFWRKSLQQRSSSGIRTFMPVAMPEGNKQARLNNPVNHGILRREYPWLHGREKSVLTELASQFVRILVSECTLWMAANAGLSPDKSDWRTSGVLTLHFSDSRINCE